jgi:DMSO/TMAO reductase YedYZ molybdopterin-dependent catalytic subunit
MRISIEVIMKRSTLWIGALYGFLTSLVVMAVSYLGYAVLRLPFLPFDLFDWLTRNLPGGLVATGIGTMVSIITSLHLGPTDTTAKLAEQIMGILVVAVTGIVFGALLAWIDRRRPAWRSGSGLLAGFVLWGGMAFVELSLPGSAGAGIGIVWLAILLVGWGWQLAGLLRTAARPMPTPVLAAEPPEGQPVLSAAPASTQTVNRRGFLALVGSSAVSLVILVLGLAKFRVDAATAAPAAAVPAVVPTGSSALPAAGTPAAPALPLTFPFGPQYTSGPAASPALDVLAKRLAAAPGTRPEVTPASNFYRIDINTFPPTVDGSSWRLEIKGLLNKPLSLSLDDIRSLPSVTQALTMECISNTVGGDLTSSNFWTGVRLKDVLAKAGVASTATDIAMTAADGFYEGISLTEAMDERVLLVYAMNGAPLTAEHGYPLRIYIPNHYGMKQPKWLMGMELVNQPPAGYWVDRGWSETAIPQTTAVIDTVNVDQAAFAKTGIMPLGGIAWAGTRGISKVEVQVDNGAWNATELINPALSPLTWVQWRYDWKTTAGSHQVAVRATDGTGITQTTVPSDPAPEGATGVFTVTINI